MESCETEWPECPVCLQNYDDRSVVPRVLGCGHTACEACLGNLPQRYTQTIRCPACNQLVKYPAQGASALPKNIDLLRLCPPQNPSPKPQIENKERSPNCGDRHQFLPRFWSEEFYSLWKDWVLPYESVLVEPNDEEEGKGICAMVSVRTASASSLPIRGGFRENQTVSLVRIVSLPTVSDSSVFDYSYVARIMKCLSGMEEAERDELRLVLRTSLGQQGGMHKIYGLWGDLDCGFLELVCERQRGNLLEKLGGYSNGEGLTKDGMSGFLLVGVGICEAVISLHLEGLFLGSLDLSCFSFDNFGRVHVDFSGVLVASRKVHKSVVEAVSGRSRIDDNALGVIFGSLLKSKAFLSPELLPELLQKEGVAVECGTSGYSVSFSSDVWSLACVLMTFILGRSFTEQISDISTDFSTYYLSWVEKVSSLLEKSLGSEYASSSQILCKCLSLDPESRPFPTDVRRCLRELIIKPQFDVVGGLEGGKVDKSLHCLILGELCRLPTKSAKIFKKYGGEDVDQGDEAFDQNFVEVLCKGVTKFKDLQGHLDCITGLAVGGDFLFSSSFDKTVCVWSLQDFSHVHTFIGHEHRVMALVYVDGEQLCISGDSGGGIFVWSSAVPLRQDPLKKWYEQKDWRYSGIHALTISGNGHIYSGSGDKSIKAWSLLDGTLSCTMIGHKSVVSTLAVCDGVLYSGSWDGTIRLWSLSDHSSLAVLGEDMPGIVTSILPFAADGHLLVAAHENGYIKVWRNDALMKSTKLHNGAIFTAGVDGKWLFTGGWDKSVKVQELSGDEFQIDVIPTGSISCDSVITALFCWKGKLIVGYADRSIKVYYNGK